MTFLSDTTTVLFLIFCMILFFSVHGYYDIQQFRLPFRRGKRVELHLSSGAFLASMISYIFFWPLFIGTPFLILLGKYDIFSRALIDIPVLLQMIGALIMLCGVLLADWGRASRGIFAPATVLSLDDYTLTDKGAYGVVRHPLYLSYIIMFIGLVLFTRNALLLVTLIGIPGHYLLAKEEDNLLADLYGEWYEKYRKKVGMLVPKIKR